MLSRQPTVCDGRLEPRHVDLRPFVMARGDRDRRDPRRPHAGRLRRRRARRQLLPERRRQGHLGAPVSRPLIGVTTSELRHRHQIEPTPQGEPEQTEMALGIRYLEAVEQAGGIPVVLPPLRPRRSARCSPGSAACCSPAAPTSTRTPTAPAGTPCSGRPSPALDAFEVALARRADRAGDPDPRDLPRRPDDQHLPRRHAPSAPPRRHRRDGPPPPEHLRRAHVARRHDRPRQPARERRRARPARRQLLPPPGDRPARPRSAGRRLGRPTGRSRRSRRRRARSCSASSGTPRRSSPSAASASSSSASSLAADVYARGTPAASTA